MPTLQGSCASSGRPPFGSTAATSSPARRSGATSSFPAGSTVPTTASAASQARPGCARPWRARATSDDEPHVSEDRGQLPAGVASVLAVAEIPSSKLGRARRARLSELEREFYFWMLRRFATHGRPTSAEMHDAAARLDVDFETALATLAGEEIQVRLAPHGEASWEPTSAVVVTGVLERCEESFRGCCPALNFFASSDNGERWLEEHPEVRGQVVSISDAIAAGRAVFGNIFDKR